MAAHELPADRYRAKAAARAQAIPVYPPDSEALRDLRDAVHRFAAAQRADPAATPALVDQLETAARRHPARMVLWCFTGDRPMAPGAWDLADVFTCIDRADEVTWDTRSPRGYGLRVVHQGDTLWFHVTRPE